MKTTRTLADDDIDRQTVLLYLQTQPHEVFEESQVSVATGVAKMHIRRLMRGVPGIDETILDAGKVCWHPPTNPNES